MCVYIYMHINIYLHMCVCVHVQAHLFNLTGHSAELEISVDR